MQKKTSSILSQEVKPNKLKSEESCCSGNVCSASTNQTLLKPTSARPKPAFEIQKNPKTRIVIKFNVGFGNTLYLRGNGGGLNWEKGIPLKNVNEDEWRWETDHSFASCEFKVLINDKQYEVGDNHRVICGGTIHYSPHF